VHGVLSLVSQTERQTIGELVAEFPKTLPCFDGDLAVEGLLTFKGFACEICGKLTESRHALTQHHSSSHRGQAAKFREATIQQLDPSNRFEVFFLSRLFTTSISLSSFILFFLLFFKLNIFLFLLNY